MSVDAYNAVKLPTKGADPSHAGASSRAELRKFGLLVGGIFVVVLGLVAPWLRHRHVALWPLIVGGLLVAGALLAPSALGPIYRVWMKLGGALGWINSRLLLSAIFFLLVTPMGLVMRLLGRDPMARRKDLKATTYRLVSESRPPERMKEPY